MVKALRVLACRLTRGAVSVSDSPYSTTYVALCQLMLYNIRVRFRDVEVDLAGVSNTSVWKIEQGGGANPATLKKLADVLGVRPTELLKERR